MRQIGMLHEFEIARMLLKRGNGEVGPADLLAIEDVHDGVDGFTLIGEVGIELKFHALPSTGICPYGCRS